MGGVGEAVQDGAILWAEIFHINPCISGASDSYHCCPRRHINSETPVPYVDSRYMEHPLLK